MSPTTRRAWAARAVVAIPTTAAKPNAKTTAKATVEAEAAPPLNRERILAATLALIDRDGVAAFSLRELAKVLGVYPTAIYWHVPNRNELVSGAVALALGGVDQGLKDGPWQDRLRALFRRFRQALRQHPRLAPVVGGELLSNGALEPALIDHLVQALEDAGYTGTAMVEAYNVTVAALCGFVTMELATAPPQDAEAWAAAHRERVAAIPTDDHPALARHLPQLRDRGFILRWTSGTARPMDTSFEAWVEVFIAGLAARAAGLQALPPADKRK